MPHLYLHIPFCSHRCGYCDFLSSDDLSLKQSYMEALTAELAMIKANYGSRLKTIFIGGGTPSLLNLSETEKLLNAIAKQFDSDIDEFSIEANPESVTAEKVALWAAGGINRVSCGMQAGQPKLLDILERRSSYTQVEATINYLNRYNIKRYNIDLIYGIPEQSIDDLLLSVEMALKLGTKHLSTYALKLEKDVRMAKTVAKGELIMPEDDMVSDQLAELILYLEDRGFCRYEISNFAQNGEESLHNLAYWRAFDTLGAGVGAVYKVANTRYQNVSAISEYLELIKRGRLPIDQQKTEVLSREELIYEYLICNFRLARGVNAKEFKALFGIDFRKQYSDWIERMRSYQVLLVDGDNYAFNHRGMNTANYLLSYL